jgi:hypothetical protein
MGEFDEVNEFLREITEESSVAGGIRHVNSDTIPPLENCRGFSILR